MAVGHDDLLRALPAVLGGLATRPAAVLPPWDQPRAHLQRRIGRLGRSQEPGARRGRALQRGTVLTAEASRRPGNRPRSSRCGGAGCRPCSRRSCSGSCGRCRRAAPPAELQADRGHLVEVRRFADLAAVETDVAPTEVVAHHEDHIRFRIARGARGTRQKWSDDEDR